MEKDYECVTIEDLLEKGVKSNGNLLSKKEILSFFNVEEGPLESYGDNESVCYKDIIPKK